MPTRFPLAAVSDRKVKDQACGDRQLQTESEHQYITEFISRNEEFHRFCRMRNSTPGYSLNVSRKLRSAVHASHLREKMDSAWRPALQAPLGEQDGTTENVVGSADSRSLSSERQSEGDEVEVPTINLTTSLISALPHQQSEASVSNVRQDNVIKLGPYYSSQSTKVSDKDVTSSDESDKVSISGCAGCRELTAQLDQIKCQSRAKPDCPEKIRCNDSSGRCTNHSANRSDSTLVQSIISRIDSALAKIREVAISIGRANGMDKHLMRIAAVWKEVMKHTTTAQETGSNIVLIYNILKFLYRIMGAVYRLVATARSCFGK